MSGENKKGKLVVISGPSGVGKTTICREVVKREPNACITTSITTREKSEREVDGEDYHFVSKEEFEQQIKNDALLEYAEVFGNYYGTLKAQVEQNLSEGKIVILEIDVQGGRQIKSLYPNAEMIFILPPAQKELAKRMEGRGRDNDEAAQTRLHGAGTEIASAFQYYEHMVINDDFEHAVDEVVGLIKKAAF